MTTSIIRESKALVRQARTDMGLSRADFGTRLGFTGEHIRLVEHGLRAFPSETIIAGLTHPDFELRAFWLDYWSLRQREQQQTMIENALTMGQPAQGGAA